MCKATYTVFCNEKENTSIIVCNILKSVAHQVVVKEWDEAKLIIDY